MKDNEFADKFLPEFRVCLPQLAKSLKERPEHKETLKRWRGVVNGIELQDAIDVLNRMVAGDIPRPFLDNVAADVKREATKLARARQFAQSIPQNNGREPRYSCHKCRDSGRASIVHTSVLTAIKQGVPPKTRRNLEGEEIPVVPEMAVPCNCERGQAMAQGRTIRGKQYKAIPHLGQRSWHLVRTGDAALDYASAVEWVSNQGAPAAA